MWDTFSSWWLSLSIGQLLNGHVYFFRAWLLLVYFFFFLLPPLPWCSLIDGNHCITHDGYCLWFLLMMKTNMRSFPSTVDLLSIYSNPAPFALMRPPRFFTSLPLPVVYLFVIYVWLDLCEEKNNERNATTNTSTMFVATCTAMILAVA